MLGQRYKRRKNQTICTNTSCRGLVPQIAFNHGALRNEPQYTMIYLFQNPHPNIINIRCDLVIGVEAAENETLLWKTYLGTRKLLIRYATSSIISLETVW